MLYRLKGFLLASLLLVAASSAYAWTPLNKTTDGGASVGECQLGCICYYATYSAGECGTVSDSGCYVLSCCCI
jgi:hypothetical protein